MRCPSNKNILLIFFISFFILKFITIFVKIKINKKIMNIEELKKIKLDSLDTEKLEEHKNNILSLNEKEIIEYLKYALDTFYNTDNFLRNIEYDNDIKKDISIFFKKTEFIPFFKKILMEDKMN